MCGRFTQKLTWRRIHDLYSLTGLPLNLQPRYNGAPAQDFAVCRLDEDGNRAIAQLRWGLVPSWARDVRMGNRLINARSETVHAKPSFGAAFRSRRCLVPADGWFEWRRTERSKRPTSWRSRTDHRCRSLLCGSAGTRAATPSSTFTIITTAASPRLAHIHHRQPAIIDPDRFDDWLDPTCRIRREIGVNCQDD